jgi:hypothetical protein
MLIQLILLATFLIPAILFLLTQFNTLRIIRPENRLMGPGWVWLQLVPLVGQIWQFVVIVKIANSIRNQWQVVDNDSILGISMEEAAAGKDSKPTLVIGLIYCSLYVMGLFLNFFSLNGLYVIPGSIFIAAMICWIGYWVTLANWKRRLIQRFRFTI